MTSFSSAPLRLLVLTGSTREGRFAPVVTGWFLRVAAERDDLTLDPADLADHPDGEGLAERLAAADAFVVVTPEYNHSFPAPLKQAIDRYRDEWQAKPVGFVSYGGFAGGLRAVEQLRQVFAELHATTVRDSVSFPLAWERFDADGVPHDPAVPEGAAKAMLDQLVWWGRALRAGRAAVPYRAG
ncbi:NADPH-dependent FMN reductase [Streptomyces sp. UH6]|uniref:NADPH-dependent FMN reductase n=1 Tax=Streptomyces sp. UH6 TaxID=2748379 RepID=UPI0015D49785|nr:NAD(P)H-dependent oxidoreductase [Streptomyces sp. UH6]NYV75843.1 NAD(P)H-dependent oxidoreductase [Streptomyces sp. UH6]